MFSMDVSTLQDMIGFLNAATGWDCDVAELDETGERIANLRQIFNIREGHIPHLRSFPEIVRHNPDAGGGPLANVEVDYETAGRDWMREMRWDLTTGEPDPLRLKDLGIEEYAL
jgi:aldehyde:ferredoxin oxidoreductase